MTRSSLGSTLGQWLNLDSTVIRPGSGERLLVSDGDFTLTIDRLLC